MYRNIPLPGRTTGKEETLVRGPRETFQPTPSRLSDQVNVNDPIAALKQGFTEMEDFWNDLSDFEREHTDMVNFDQYINIDGPDDEEVQSETVAEDSTMEDLDDYDIEMANLFGEEPERQTKRKRESDFPEALPGDVDHDEKRRKLEIGTGSSQAPPPGLRKNGKKEKDGKFENRNLNWQANAIPANKAGREEQQSPPTDASLAILALLPMNGTFERRQVIVPFYPDFLRVGRQVSAETVPTAINGFFDSMVVSKVHASVWAEEETGKIRVKDLGSSNGTFVNGVRLSAKNQENEPHELREQDTLDLGIDVVSDDQKTIIHHRVSAKVELAGVYTKVSHDETIRGTNGGLIFLESQQHASTVSELDSIDQEASKDSSGNSAELQPSVQTEEKQSPVVTIPRTARFTDSVWIRRSLRARNGYTTKRYDEQTRPSREFRSFFATRRQRKELLRKGEKVWNEEDAAFIRTGKKFEEPGARLRAELVAKSLLDVGDTAFLTPHESIR